MAYRLDIEQKILDSGETEQVIILVDTTSSTDREINAEIDYTGYISRITTAFETATQKLSTIAEQITDIATESNRIADNQDTIATQTTSIATESNRIADNQDTIATQTTSIATESNRIADNQDTIATQTTSIATESNRIADNQDTIASKTTSIDTSIDALKEAGDPRSTGDGIRTLQPYGEVGLSILYLLYIKQAQMIEENYASQEDQDASIDRLREIITELRQTFGSDF